MSYMKYKKLSQKLAKSLECIDKQLFDIEMEYSKKNILAEVQKDRTYVFFEGKMVAYCFCVQELGFSIRINRTTQNRIHGWNLTGTKTGKVTLTEIK